MANGGDPKLKLWSLILMVGSGMLFLMFFMPWWSIKFPLVVPPQRPEGANFASEEFKQWQKDMKAYKEDNEDKMEKAVKVLSKNRRWYEDKVGDKFKEESKEASKDGRTGTVRLWGWSVGVSITGFILSFVLLPIAIVPIFVPFLKRWIWTGYFAAAVIGLIMLILSMVWYFSSPGENVSGMLSQGVGFQPGPYFALLGSLAVLAAGVLGGVFGLLHFLKELKAAKSGAPVEAADPAIEGDDEFVEE